MYDGSTTVERGADSGRRSEPADPGSWRELSVRKIAVDANVLGAENGSWTFRFY